MSAADKRLKAKPKKAENQSRKRLKTKPTKAEKQKRVCQKFMTHPLFFYFFKDLLMCCYCFVPQISQIYTDFFFIRDLLLQSLQILIEPDIHLISTSMIPSIIRNQGEFLILHRNLAISSLIEHLSIGLNSLH